MNAAVKVPPCRLLQLPRLQAYVPLTCEPSAEMVPSSVSVCWLGWPACSVKVRPKSGPETMPVVVSLGGKSILTQPNPSTVLAAVEEIVVPDWVKLTSISWPNPSDCGPLTSSKAHLPLKEGL